MIRVWAYIVTSGILAAIALLVILANFARQRKLSEQELHIFAPMESHAEARRNRDGFHEYGSTTFVGYDPGPPLTTGSDNSFIGGDLPAQPSQEPK